MSEVITHQQFGLEEQKANEILGNLPQIKAEREALATQYDEVIKMDIDSPETAKTAGELRKRIKDNRTKGILVWHKAAKELFLRGGQFCDAVKNVEIAVNERMEENLEKIEKHAELKEAKRKEELKAKRSEELLKYVDSVEYYPLAEMPEEAYQNLLSGSIASWEKKKAEEEAELKRQEEARLEQERQAKIKEQELSRFRQLNDLGFNYTEPGLGELSDKEFEKILTQKKREHEKAQAEKEAKEALKKERLEKVSPFIMYGTQIEVSALAELTEAQFKKILSEKEKAYSQAKEAEAQEKAEIEARLEAERQAAEKARIEKEEAQKKAAEAAEALAAEQRKRDEELKAEKQRIEAERKAKSDAEKAPDKEKIKALSMQLSEAYKAFKPNVQSEEAKAALKEFEASHNRMCAWLITKSENL